MDYKGYSIDVKAKLGTSGRVHKSDSETPLLALATTPGLPMHSSAGPLRQAKAQRRIRLTVWRGASLLGRFAE